MEQIEEKGTDSYVGRIAIDNKDTLSFDLGWYSNQLYEYDPQILDSSMVSMIDTSIMDKNQFVFVKNSANVDPDRYRKNNVLWDTIDGGVRQKLFIRDNQVLGQREFTLTAFGHPVTMLSASIYMVRT